MFRSLVWKEWHEQRWRLWFGVFLLGAPKGAARVGEQTVHAE